MNLPNFLSLKIKLSILLLATLLSACSLVETKPDSSQLVHHVVFVWLKDSANMDHRETIIDTSRALKQIPGVLSITAGQPVLSERKIVDDSFDVGITFTFSSVDEMRAYLKHPQHVKAVKEVLQPLISKIVVYDYK